MVGKQIDVVLEQGLQALLHPTGHAARLTAPKQAVVHHDGIGVDGDGGLNQGQTGCDA